MTTTLAVVFICIKVAFLIYYLYLILEVIIDTLDKARRPNFVCISLSYSMYIGG